MKKTYEYPKIEITLFLDRDIITSSTFTGGENPGGGDNDPPEKPSLDW